MEQYIDKSALVAEIKRIEHETNYEPFTDEVLGKRRTCRSLLSFIDTLEVKEVDLEDDVDNILESYDWNYDKIDFCQFAKHFFELGLELQNGD